MVTANADIPVGDGERRHDPMCLLDSDTCCPWMGDCDCQCICDLISRVREDERAAALQCAIDAVIDYWVRRTQVEPALRDTSR